MTLGSYQLRNRSLQERLLAQCTIPDDLDACWGWTGTFTIHSGKWRYGRLKLTGRKSIGAHRASYLVHNGDIPKGLIVRHNCDNSECCNPRHLILGTHKDNTADMFDRDRARPPKGGQHHNTHLTELIVQEIRQLLREGVKQKEIAAKFSIHQSTVSDISTGRTWRHLPEI
jgi:predicted XRE-type DNA-binding protein